MPHAYAVAPRSDCLGDRFTRHARNVDVDGREVGAQPAHDRRDGAALADQVMAVLEGSHRHTRNTAVRGVQREEDARLEQPLVQSATHITRVLLARSRVRCYLG
ncbi:hypothetical protein FA951_13500 [Dermacoccus nishinomiyaensis]|uniref:hypothetical protein n=1 Tax=Dermacoccus nishinomiyaensis TaxID=1274 RepID=UPI0010AD378D|nr:hypothetical protein [Dermacoccus nishinomiyaensis]TJZ94896.1 hypothetical protein FA951_13500 [Dermacoccus nishinomiyaensis]